MTKLTPTRLVHYSADGKWLPQTTRLAVVHAVNADGTVDIRVSRIAQPDLDLKNVPVDRVRLIRKDET